MRKSRWFIALVVIIALLVTAGLIIGRGKGKHGQIVVDASRLPVTVVAGGSRVTLTKASRASWSTSTPVLDVVIAAEPLKRGQCPTEEYCIMYIGGEGFRWQTASFGSPPFCFSFEMEKSGSTCDLLFGLQTNAQPPAKEVVFRDVVPSQLPISKKIGPVLVTLEKAYYGFNPEYLRFHSLGDDQKCFNVHYAVSGPPDNFRVSKDRYDIHSQPYWFQDNTSIRVRDESGKELPGMKGSSGETSGARTVFCEQTRKLTLAETWIGKVNRGWASDMITERALAAAMKSNRVFTGYYCFECDHQPKRFTFSINIGQPPTSRKRGEILFKNVRIPAK